MYMSYSSVGEDYERLEKELRARFRELSRRAGELIPAGSEIRVTVDTSAPEFPADSVVYVNGVEDEEAWSKLREKRILDEIEHLASEYTRIFVYTMSDEEIVADKPVKIIIEPL